MIYSFQEARLHLHPESVPEKELLGTIDSHTKLAYFNGLPSAEKRLPKIYLRQGQPSIYDKSTQSMVFGEQDNKAFWYSLRAITDGHHIQEGRLPLHAGCINDNGRKIFLLGNTRSGKSTISSLATGISGLEVIADDHCIIGANEVVGNGVIRIREENEKETYMSTHQRITNLEDYSICIIQLANANTVQFIPNKDELDMQTMCSGILKYVISGVQVNGTTVGINETFGHDIIGTYKNRFLAFLDSADQIHVINGQPDFLFEEVTK